MQQKNGDGDPLARFTLANGATEDVSSVPSLEVNNELLADVSSTTSLDIANDRSEIPVVYVGKELQADNEEEFEWVEVNAEDDDEGEGEDRYEYWEGDLGPMTEEEEAELLREAEMELAELERKAANKKRASSAFEGELGEAGSSGAILAQDEQDDYFEEEEEEEDRFEYWEGDLPPMTAEEEAELLREAEAELAQLEGESNSRQSKNGPSAKVVSVQKTPPPIHAEFEDAQAPREASELKGSCSDTETPNDDEDEEAFIARITKEIEAETRTQKKGSKIRDTEENSPKRGIPAVMRCFDQAKVYAKAGNGGNGVVAFRREKYVPFGGPSGGSGGRGGNIYVEADASMNSLLSFRRSVHFRGGRGNHGQGKSQDGAAGVDCTIKVPLGTVIREAGDSTRKVLLELTRPGQRELLLPGGRGGRGNAAFKTGRNNTPQLAENGEEGAEMWLELELKLVADVGIIGVPNAGKSTFLSAISAAQPAIGAYPFTTLLPNLGVVPIGFEASMVVADLPGLLEGAHLGIGLGHEFLRHTERCRVLVHIVDGMSQQPKEEFEAVRLELQLFNPAISDKPYLVAFNKMDIPEAAERWQNFQAYLKEKGIDPICMSAATKMGTTEVVHRAFTILQSLPSVEHALHTSEEDTPAIGEMVRRQRSAPIEQFEIFYYGETKTWKVQGIGLERFTQMTNWEYFEALRRFQYVLSASGVNQALRERGVAEGDTVIVGEMEFVWHDSENILASDWKRGFRGSKVWPH